MKTTRKHDNEIEKLVGSFLDKHFYKRISEKKRVDVTRWRDREHQLAGIDVTIGNVNFDEKCKCYGCMNSILKYPSFEISLDLRTGKRLEGWFVNEKLKTDYYSFLGVFASVGTPKELVSEEQLEKVDVLWVKKSDVWEMVSQVEGLDGTKLTSLARNLVVESDGSRSYDQKFRKSFPSKKFWLTYSPKLFERPVNLVVPRETLVGLKHSRHFTVSRTEIT